MTDELHAVGDLHDTAVHPTSITADERTRRLTQILASKVDQGYRIESQTDSEAVLTTRGRARWFGLRGHMPGSRQRIAVDEQGRTSTRKLSR